MGLLSLRSNLQILSKKRLAKICWKSSLNRMVACPIPKFNEVDDAICFSFTTSRSTIVESFVCLQLLTLADPCVSFYAVLEGAVTNCSRNRKENFLWALLCTWCLGSSPLLWKVVSVCLSSDSSVGNKFCL